MSDKIPINKNNKLLNTAKALRKNMTRQEKHLWFDFLRGYPIKTYKQRIIGNYIADFYCASAKLVIELDGAQHYTESGLKYDEIRSEYMNGIDILVIRIPNMYIDKYFYEICLYLDDKIKSRITDTNHKAKGFRNE